MARKPRRYRVSPEKLKDGTYTTEYIEPMLERGWEVAAVVPIPDGSVDLHFADRSKAGEIDDAYASSYHEWIRDNQRRAAAHTELGPDATEEEVVAAYLEERRAH